MSERFCRFCQVGAVFGYGFFLLLFATSLFFQELLSGSLLMMSR